MDKPTTYFTHVRHDLIPYIPVLPEGKLLEVGCAAANTLCFIRSKNIAGEVYGTDLENLPDSNQQNPLIHQFVPGDLTAENLPFEKEFFDVLICADILEHLPNPWKTLKYLSQFLKPGGTLITSMPNIRDFTVMYKLLIKGDFTYTSSGVLDKTHLRFFTQKTMEDLVREAGFEIEQVNPSFRTCPLQPKRRMMNRATLGVLKGFIAQQFIIKATKPR